MRRLCFFLLGCFSLSCGPLASEPGHQWALFQPSGYDIVVDAYPLLVRSVDYKTSIDAIIPGENPEGVSTVVTFKIEQVAMGELPQVRRGGPSDLQQMKDLIEDKNILGLLTMDIKDPDEMVDREWLNIAVHSVIDTFGIYDRQEPERKTHRLYLKNAANRPGTFELVDHKPR